MARRTEARKADRTRRSQVTGAIADRHGWLLALGSTGAMTAILAFSMLSHPAQQDLAFADLVGDDPEWSLNSEVLAVEPSLPAPVYAEAEPVNVQAPEPESPEIAHLETPQPVISGNAEQLDHLLPVARSDEPVELATAELIDDLSPDEVALASASIDLEISETLEEDLNLSKGQRRIIQRRLVLAGYDPKGVDGIFGDGTRTAIAQMQIDDDLEPSGYLDAMTLLSLTSQTEAKYAVWREATSKARARRAALAAAEVPPQRPNASPEKRSKCARDETGKIIGYQGFICDLTGMGEALIAFDAPATAGDDTPRFADALENNSDR